MTSEKNRKESPILCQKKTWEKNENNIWLASSISLQRNIEKFQFPGKLRADQLKQIISLVSKEFLSTKIILKPTLVKAEDLNPLEKAYLTEHFISSSGYHHAHVGEAFVLDDSGEFLMTLNIKNHIQFLLLDYRGEIESAWNHMVKIETELGKRIAYSYSQKFGFLTSDPYDCGTALRISLYVQPTTLIHTEKINEVLERCSTTGISITGIQDHPNEWIGGLLKIQNSYSLGVTEENIISNIRTFLTKLLVEENSARAHARQEGNAELKDKVSRAYGILIHSYQIGTIEALDAISLVKLGTDLGWVKGATIASLNHLFLNCRRAHLICEYGEDITPEELPHRRAEYIHQALKKVSLAI